MDSLATAIRRHLARYLTGTLTLNEFQDWLVNATWNVHEDEAASPQAVQLADDITLVLAELSSGFMTFDELRADLLEIAKREPSDTEAAIGA